MGIQTCRSCHSEIYDSFIETGMGQSFDHANKEKSAAIYDEHALVYDEKSDFYYKPFFDGTDMYIKEFRLEGKDTVHSRLEKIAYIVGSGQHTNSHIININGYTYQAPITFYTQEQKWDLAPGYEEFNQRFSRTLEAECMTCHNHFPKQVEGSFHKFEEMPKGIECERCHGPGEIHVKEKLSGQLVDTAQYIDYSIVNPKDLDRNLQMDICQRCHLQGLAVLKEDKTFYDFKPGMELSSVMNVYLPRYTNSHEKFIMASQADRLKLSPCFIKSDELTCITCHNPHHSVNKTDQQQYINACLSCHKSEINYCSASTISRKEKNDNCISCHMPKSGSVDIPHVKITDHYISVLTANKAEEIEEEEKDAIAEFLGLQIMTKEKASNQEMAQAYVSMYDKHVQAPQILDSAKYYLDLIPKSKETFDLEIHYFFAKENFKAITELAANISYGDLKKPWTLYRVGEAFMKQDKFDKALPYLFKAIQLQPYDLDFQEKFGMANLKLGKIDAAEETFQFILKENPKRKVSLNNYGVLNQQLNRKAKAEECFRKAIALDPDYLQAQENLKQLLSSN